MMIVRTFAVASLFSILGGHAFAGWYNVDNYEGTVGARAIRLSLQRYEFGSGITIEGSYYFVEDRRPAALYGEVKGRSAVLCEIADEGELERVVVRGSKSPFTFDTCPLRMKFNGERAEGVWHIDGSDEVVLIRRVATLDDRKDPIISGAFTVPFWAQTETRMFVGTYEAVDIGVCMTNLDVVDKATGHSVQTLRFGTPDCTAGMVMTPIYMNVQKWMKEGTEVISVNFKDNFAGYSEDYVFDQRSGQFVKSR